MPLPGAKPHTDRSQVRHRAPVAEWTEFDDVPFEDGPKLPPRARSTEAAWGDAGVLPGSEWPAATKRWWEAQRKMPHAVAWSQTDWEFAFATAEVHARTCEGWRGYGGGELRQREKIMGSYWDARRDLRIRYVKPKPKTPDADLPAGVTPINRYQDL